MRGVSLVAVNAAKTSCARGHLLEGANLMRRASGERGCRACHNTRRLEYARTANREYHAANREQINARKRAAYAGSR